jgi:hypothetical protein
MLPNRIGDVTRYLGQLATRAGRLEETADGYRERISGQQQQQQLDAHKGGGILHRARHSKTMEQLGTAIVRNQRQLSVVEQDVAAITPDHQRYTTRLGELQQHQTLITKRLGKVSERIDTDLGERIWNAINHGVPTAVAEAIKPLGQRPKEQGKERMVSTVTLVTPCNNTPRLGKCRRFSHPNRYSKSFVGAALDGNSGQ